MLVALIVSPPKAGRSLAVRVPVCLLTGVAASAINGELAQSGWLVFASVDSLLVWLGAAAAFLAFAGARRMRASWTPTP